MMHKFLKVVFGGRHGPVVVEPLQCTMEYLEQCRKHGDVVGYPALWARDEDDEVHFFPTPAVGVTYLHPDFGKITQMEWQSFQDRAFPVLCGIDQTPFRGLFYGPPADPYRWHDTATFDGA